MKKRTIIIFLMLIILSSLGLHKINQSDKLTVAYYETYTVQAGDNLWGIAEQYNHGKDIRQFIYIIEDNNKISANLQVGQEILVPILEQR